MSSDDATLAEGVVEKLKVGLLEEALGRAFGVRRVGDDDIEGVLVVIEELEAVTNVDSALGVGKTSSHAGEELLGDTDNSLINVAKDGLLNTVVLDNLAENTAVTTTNDKNLLGVGVGVHGKVCNHLLVRELIALGALNDVVENENGSVVGGLEDKDVLVLALLVVKDLVDLEGHGLA